MDIDVIIVLFLEIAFLISIVLLKNIGFGF